MGNLMSLETICIPYLWQERSFKLPYFQPLRVTGLQTVEAPEPLDWIAVWGHKA